MRAADVFGSIDLVSIPAGALIRGTPAEEIDAVVARHRDLGLGFDLADGEPDHPASGLTWEAAVEFCEWLSNLAGTLVRLPTEHEWERATRGDDAREYPWGDTFDWRLANLAEHGVGGPIAVGSLPGGASPFGVLDMAGNVDEWTSTVYAPYPDAPEDVAPVETWSADPHITRGGSYTHHRDLARCARRHGVYIRGEGAGIRVATGAESET